MSTLTVLHNPRCSKSREVVELLTLQQVEFTTIEYLKSPLSAAKIQSILSLLSCSPLKAVRQTEPTFKTLDLANQALNLQQWAQILCEHPILIQRPIIYSDTRAVIGRPPNVVLEML